LAGAQFTAVMASHGLGGVGLQNDTAIDYLPFPAKNVAR
jgi:hypothetical protein